MSNKKIVKASFQMTTKQAADHRAAGTAPVLSDLSFGHGKTDAIEKGDRVSIRVGTRRKLFRVERVYMETVTYKGEFGYPDDVSFFTRIALKAKPQK